MSMLTPLGAGGRSRTRGRRRWPRALLVLIVLGLVAAAGYLAWRWLSEDQQDSPAATTPNVICRTPTVSAPASLRSPARITMDVANGTARPGLAVATADTLVARGFVVDDIGNTDKPVKSGIAVVRYQPDDLDGALTIAAFVPGSRLQPVQRAAVPQLWLGPQFPGAGQGIVSAEQADPASVTLPTLDPVCRTPRS